MARHGTAWKLIIRAPVVVLRENRRHGNGPGDELDHPRRQARRQHAVRLPREAERARATERAGLRVR